MSYKSLEMRAIALALAPNTLTTTIAPGPGPSQSNAKPALKRCIGAWKRAFKAYLATIKKKDSYERSCAAREGGTAYCNAMPMLAGYEGIRDFVACAAHGILIDAIPLNKSAQILYAVQVALTTLHFDQKQANPPSK
jgi:hypothetical protein